jgi:hypothetical protein
MKRYNVEVHHVETQEDKQHNYVVQSQVINLVQVLGVHDEMVIQRVEDQPAGSL